MRRLAKREVEALAAVLDGGVSPESPADQVRRLVAALTPALAVVVDAAPDDGWTALTARAAAVGGWTAERAATVASAAEPSVATVATVAALWELVTELNEVRGLEPARRSSG